MMAAASIAAPSDQAAAPLTGEFRVWGHLYGSWSLNWEIFPVEGAGVCCRFTSLASPSVPSPLLLLLFYVHRRSFKRPLLWTENSACGDVVATDAVPDLSLARDLSGRRWGSWELVTSARPLLLPSLLSSSSLRSFLACLNLSRQDWGTSMSEKVSDCVVLSIFPWLCSPNWFLIGRAVPSTFDRGKQMIGAIVCLSTLPRFQSSDKRMVYLWWTRQGKSPYNRRCKK
jgi:hypothetical protein